MDRFAVWTNDVEVTSIWFNTLRNETGYKVFREGMPLLLDVYAQHGIKSTFFFNGDIAEQFPDIVKMILPYGHEVASHGYSHRMNEAFDIMDFKGQLENLTKTKKILEDISGQEVITFRAPSLRVNEVTPLALREAGYKIDSSVPSQRFDFFMSFGGIKKLAWLKAPRLPYITDEKNLSRRGQSGIVELPLSAFFLPFIGTTMRIFPVLTRIQRHFIHLEGLISKKPVVFIIHPNEFIDEKDEPRKIERRAKSFYRYIMTDLLRSKFKAKNLGEEAIGLYDEQIRYFEKRKYRTVTIKEYITSQGFKI